MELWVRSQDKKILQKVNKLYATTYSEEAGYGIYYLRYDDLEDIDDCDVPLGFYKSKERALEVLDEIQNSILGILTLEDIEAQEIKKYTGRATFSKITKQLVYIMPEE